MDLPQSRFADASLSILRAFLWYNQPPIEGDQLARLGRLPNLACLFVYGSITPQDRVPLRSLSGIECLYVYPSNFTREHAAELAHLARLRDLAVFGADIDPGVFPMIGQLKELEYLRLTGSRLGTRGLVEVSKIKQLKLLYVDDTDVTDAAVFCLENLPNLEYLALNGTSLSDTSLNSLGRMTNLTSLTIQDTSISPAGVRYLRRELQKCAIGY